MMKPKSILLFVVVVLIGLGILSFLYPKDGIKITDNFVLQFETWDEFWHPVKNKDISDILENNVIDDDSVEFVVQEHYDSVYIDSVLVVYKPVDISVDSNLQHIEYPPGADTILDGVFVDLGSIQSTGDRIHIVHYGDSQIEVDRMTSYIRHKLQSTFGGYGCGFHTGIQAFDFQQPLVVSYSDNWYRYKLFPHKDSVVTHRRFGISTSFSKYVEIGDSTYEEKSAWIKFDKYNMGYATSRRFGNVSLYYGHNETDVSLEIYDGGNLLASEVLTASEGVHVKKWYFENPTSVKFVYTGTSSPEIYGYSFDSPVGLTVDNIPVRGSAGLFFGRLDFGVASSIFSSMNVKLILMQFGGNAVSPDSAAIKNYAQMYGKQMKYLKQMAPDAQIIVIGPADMAEKDKNSYVTRQNLPLLIDLIKEEAFKNGCAFWNMYEAMGGENSIASWVFHDPPLAEKDFVHFTPQGANIVSQMFYKALIYDYNKFLQTR